MLLAFDTATQTASVAIYNLQTDELLAEYTWLARRKQTQELLTASNAMFQQLGLSTNSITALAVTTGPGSFTGVRIGISAAKGIGLGLAIAPKVIGIPTLSVTAAPWFALLENASIVAEQGSNGQPPIRLCAYIQAGRGRYNWIFTPIPLAGLPQKVMLWRPAKEDHQAGTLEEFVNSLEEQSASTMILAGEKNAELEAAVGPLPGVLCIDNTSGLRRSGQLARLAAAHLSAGLADSLAELQPLYLQNP